MYGRPHMRSNGFSLIEIMVGLLIGMFGVLIVLQLLSATDTSRRITVGSGDAQINGIASLYGIDRDVREAGLGISAFTLLGCSLTYATATDLVTVTLAALAPVTINPAPSLVPAGDIQTDTLLVIGGSSSSPSEGDALTAASTGGFYQVTAASSFVIGDRVIAAPATRSSPCTLTLGKVVAIGGSVLTVSPSTASIAAGGAVYNLGASPSIHAYAIRNGNLTRCDYFAYDCGAAKYVSPVDSTVWVPVASNVVSLRAQYARDTSGISGAVSSMDGVVDSYDQITPGSSADATGIPLYCRWIRVIGLRMVLVARSQQYDPKFTSGTPTWDGASVNTSITSTLLTLTPTATAIDLGANAEWSHYRYKPIQTTIMLRNAVWQGGQVTYQGGSGGC